MEKEFTAEEAKQVGDAIGVNWEEVPIEEFRIGLGVELEHGTRFEQANVTNDDMAMTAKIALAHLLEFPDYYTRLEAMEREAERRWKR